MNRAGSFIQLLFSFIHALNFGFHFEHTSTLSSTLNNVFGHCSCNFYNSFHFPFLAELGPLT